MQMKSLLRMAASMGDKLQKLFQTDLDVINKKADFFPPFSFFYL
jgi:hypothetical protein